MSTEIYNEGRVVGYSAYEAYVRQFLVTNQDPNAQPASEREWLASSLASGTSLIVEVPADSTTYGDTDFHTVDIELPSTTSLRAANIIMGNWVNIKVASSTGVTYPTKVSSYSENLVPNNSTTYPGDKADPTTTVEAENIPIATTLSDPTSDAANQEAISNYLKIKDGVILQDGKWAENPDKPPEMTFTPDLSTAPIVRLLIRGTITDSFNILLVGFTDVSILMGETGISDSIDTGSPQNGDFLGPATFPWAGKIIFGISSQLAPYLTNVIFSNRGNIIVHNSSDNTNTNTGTEYISDDSGTRKFINLNTDTYNDSPENTVLASQYNNPQFISLAGKTNIVWQKGRYYKKEGDNYVLLTEKPNDWWTSGTTVGDYYMSANDVGYVNWSQLFMALSDDKKIEIANEIIRQIGKYIFMYPLNYEEVWNNPSDSTVLSRDPDNHLFFLPSATEEESFFGKEAGTGRGFTIRVGRPYINVSGRRLYVMGGPDWATAAYDPIPENSIGIGWK